MLTNGVLRKQVANVCGMTVKTIYKHFRAS
ncbi:hypothetical protein [Brenneria izadpanahii]|nr:hypothetical protein [Brenneria izadpanahii]